MEPLKGGTLARISDATQAVFDEVHPDWTPARWGLGFAASLEGVGYVLSGMNSLEMLEENMFILGADFEPFNDSEMAAVMKARDIINSEVSIPCTGCHYCTEECPKNIPIPEYLTLIQDKHNTTQIVYYFNYVEQKYGRAGECIKCGLCEKHCPQHLPIREYLTSISKSFDFFKGWRN